MLQLTANAEDYLERLYMHEVEGDAAPPLPDDRVMGELLRRNYVRLDEGKLPLTRQGRQEAEQAVRRHRLAERLMNDVINVPNQQMDAVACEFEHSLHHGVAENICTLLGHPKTCPHGRPIPPGKCCREHKKSSNTAVKPLVEMGAEERGVIAYLTSRQSATVQKLMALGALPGSPIAVIQTFPSMVFQVGQTQIAVDQSLAGDIYVRRVEE